MKRVHVNYIYIYTYLQLDIITFTCKFYYFLQLCYDRMIDNCDEVITRIWTIQV